MWKIVALTRIYHTFEYINSNKRLKKIDYKLKKNDNSL